MGKNREELKKNIEKGIYEYPPQLKGKISNICKDIISKLLIQNVEKRMKWTDFFEHPMITCSEKAYESLFVENLP